MKEELLNSFLQAEMAEWYEPRYVTGQSWVTRNSDELLVFFSKEHTINEKLMTCSYCFLGLCCYLQPDQRKPARRTGFSPGMRLEAKDRKNPSLVCVATVAEVKGTQLLIHFDGWSEKYDYWCDRKTPDIHPVGWCTMHGRCLQSPKGEALWWICSLEEIERERGL